MTPALVKMNAPFQLQECSSNNNNLNWTFNCILYDPTQKMDEPCYLQDS